MNICPVYYIPDHINSLVPCLIRVIHPVAAIPYGTKGTCHIYRTPCIQIVRKAELSHAVIHILFSLQSILRKSISPYSNLSHRQTGLNGSLLPLTGWLLRTALLSPTRRPATAAPSPAKAAALAL